MFSHRKSRPIHTRRILKVEIISYTNEIIGCPKSLDRAFGLPVLILHVCLLEGLFFELRPIQTVFMIIHGINLRFFSQRKAQNHLPFSKKNQPLGSTTPPLRACIRILAARHTLTGQARGAGWKHHATGVNFRPSTL